MRDFVFLLVHVIVTICRLWRPDGARSVIAESILLKQQLLILNRSRKRAPNLRASDRFIAGVCSLFMKSSRLIRSAIVLKPSTLLSIHHALRNRKYRLLFFRRSGRKNPAPMDPPKSLLMPLSIPNGRIPHGDGRELLSKSPWFWSFPG